MYNVSVRAQLTIYKKRSTCTAGSTRDL